MLIYVLGLIYYFIAMGFAPNNQWFFINALYGISVFVLLLVIDNSLEDNY